MNRRISTRATSFGLAALVTLTLLVAVEQLAGAPGQSEVLADVSAPLQVVVITGKRVAAV